MPEIETQLQSILLESLNDLRSEAGKPSVTEFDKDRLLFGVDGELDSLALVSLIVDLEAKVQERLGVVIVLADERAMSNRASPFRNMGSLLELLRERVTEAS
jgi:acyl carrier protein